MSAGCTIAVIKNYEWPDIREYAVSLVRSGFCGERVIFHENVHADALTKLSALGFTLQEFHASADPHRGYNAEFFAFLRERFVPVVAYLDAHSDFERVLITDVRDVVFQSDPFRWLEAHSALLTMSDEYCLLKHEPTNGRWAEQAAGAEYTWLREHVILCAGVIAGRPRPLADLLREVVRRTLASASTPDPLVDQGVLNYVARLAPFKDLIHVPKMIDGFTATCGLFQTHAKHIEHRTEDPPVFDYASGQVLVPGTLEPFAIVHQYDRDPAWKRVVQSQYEEVLA
jgi:hypothetical protein